MKNHRFIVALLAIFAAVACKNSVQQVLPEFEPSIFEVTDDKTYDVRITYQRIANIEASDIFAKIEWQNYSNSFSEYEGEVASDGSVEDMNLEAMLECIVAEYSEYADFGEYGSGPMSRYIMDQTAFFVRDNSVLCYETLVESYTGGAHGMQALWYECFDLESGSLYDFSYLFEGEYGDAVRGLVYERLGDGYSLFVDNVETLPMSSSVALTETGVVFVYQPYEVAPYCEGIISVEISDEELEALGAPLLWK